MITPKISLFASAVRPKLWPALLNSIQDTAIEWEVVFAGNTSYADFPKEIMPYILRGKFRYIETANIKPAQCYEIARRECMGEVLVWIADDCEFPYYVLSSAYRYWKSQHNEKLILSIQTKESGYKNQQGSIFDMNIHRFFGGDINSPLMAPLGMISRKFLDDLGGLDVRYVCGQYENDIVMRAYSQGAIVKVFGNETCYIDIDHLGKSIAIGESTNEDNFRDRPFAKGYQTDRQVLEKSWVQFNKEKLIKLMNEGRQTVYPSEINDISPFQLDNFESYEDKDILTKSQSNKGHWE